MNRHRTLAIVGWLAAALQSWQLLYAVAPWPLHLIALACIAAAAFIAGALAFGPRGERRP